MEQRLCILISLLLMAGFTFAQTASKPDVLYKKDKSTIQVIIEEVGDNEIQYRKASSPTGPLYAISKVDVLKIVYNNGDVEQISNESATPSTAPKVTSTKPTVSKPVAASPAKEAPAKAQKSAVVTTLPSSYFGIKAGGNLFTRSVPSGYNTPGFNVGFHGGVFAGFGGKRLTFQPEVLFTQLSTTYTVADATTQTTNQLITVPLLVKYAIGEGKLRPFLQLGGFGQFLLSSSYSTTVAGQSQGTQSLKFESLEGRIEYGAIGGAGVAYSLGRVQVLLDARWYHGLGVNLSPQPTSGFIRMGAVSLGMAFPLGQK
ncbi:porin family protein [Spirosoma panaciterrae]|uniref:porin family protein n=1 Tax=Spirosoma panaciterrae TaxID=496058 RepID=UPI0003A88856|nr:porin family protein [Spirosoma panaciterrae]